VLRTPPLLLLRRAIISLLRRLLLRSGQACANLSSVAAVAATGSTWSREFAAKLCSYFCMISSSLNPLLKAQGTARPKEWYLLIRVKISSFFLICMSVTVGVPTLRALFLPFFIVFLSACFTQYAIEVL